MESICEDCYCDNGQIVCSTLECFPPSSECMPIMGKNETCCPSNYICGKLKKTPYLNKSNMPKNSSLNDCYISSIFSKIIY